MTRFLFNQTESKELEFCAYMDQMSTSAAAVMGKLSKLYSIYKSKIDFIGLELLDSKIVSKVCSLTK